MVTRARIRALEAELIGKSERLEDLADVLEIDCRDEEAHVLRQIAATLIMVVGKLHEL